MRVLVALASSSAHLSGVQRHGINLARCLLARQQVAEVHLVLAPWQLELVSDTAAGDPRLYLHSAPIGRGGLSRNLWFYRKLPKLAARLNADIVHLAYPMPLRRRAFRCPTVVTLHDLYPYESPENFGFPRVLFNRAVLRLCLRAVDAIACASQSTQARLSCSTMRIAARKAAVIYNSVERPLPAAIESPFSGLVGRQFLLCVAQHRRNKNILLALKVFARLLRSGRLAESARMLVVGIPGPETAAIKRFILASGLASSVILSTGISEGQLQWCYRNCALLFALSTVEGFGLPVAEALMAGCRIVCSDIPAFRELGAEHCRYVSLGAEEEEAFARAVAEALRGPRHGPIDLPQISASVIGGSYVHLYESLLAEQSARERFAPLVRKAKWKADIFYDS